MQAIIKTHKLCVAPIILCIIFKFAIVCMCTGCVTFFSKLDQILKTNILAGQESCEFGRKIENPSLIREFLFPSTFNSCFDIH